MKRLLPILALALAAGAPAEPKPLKVFILAGQSNMQGHAKLTTMDAMRLNPVTASILKDMRNPDGSDRVLDNVWISSIGSSDEERVGKLTTGYGADQNGTKLGPEITFGIYVEKMLGEPVLLIKTSWGGKSINTDFRPPSAGPYKFNEAQLENFKKQGKDVAAMQAAKDAETGVYYRLMMEHVKKVLADPGRVHPGYDPKAGYELAGFVWFQGWNDMVDNGTYPDRDKPGGYDAYGTVLADFIRDVRKDLGAPAMPFVIGVIGVGGPTEKYGPDQQRYKTTHQNIRDAMASPASLPEFKGNVAAVLTENYWDMELMALREKEKAIKAEEKKLKDEGKLAPAEQKAAIEKLYADTFSAEDLELLRNSVSNAEYHYLGSARILGQIGKGFAEAWGGLAGIKNAGGSPP